MTYIHTYSDAQRDDDNHEIETSCKSNKHSHILKYSFLLVSTTERAVLENVIVFTALICNFYVMNINISLIIIIYVYVISFSLKTIDE